MTDTVWEWSDWVPHHNEGWPAGVEPDEVVIGDLSGHICSPMVASKFDWCHGDPVTRYKRRVYSETQTQEVELADAL